MHLELSSRSSKSNIDTVGPSYMFYMEMANHVLRGGVVRMAVGVVLVSFGHLLAILLVKLHHTSLPGR